MVAEAAPVGPEEGGYLQHSCWTYWGHSGAPLFDATGVSPTAAIPMENPYYTCKLT